jgi:hypothetical protein
LSHERADDTNTKVTPDSYNQAKVDKADDSTQDRIGNGLLADVQISSDLGDPATQSRTLRRNSGGYLFGTVLVILSGMRPMIIH